jgi:antitoxin component YwqK of YwqJK toxin-antitoxin module
LFYFLRNIIFVLGILLLASCAGESSSTPKPRNVLFKSDYSDGSTELEVLYRNEARVSLKYFYPSGNIHTEIDSFGNYRQYFADGKLAMEFAEKDGKKIGDEKIYYSTGSLRSILKYKDGICFLREDFYENGTMSSSCKILREPKRHEICQTFYKSGNRRTVTTDDGHRTYYYESGALEKESVYRGDTLVEERENYPSGNPKRIAKYNNLVPKGCRYCALETEVSYYGNGNMMDSCYVEKPLSWDGKTDKGLFRACKKFYENGNVKKSPVYENGNLLESKEYYSSGELEKYVAYDGIGPEGKNTVEIRYRKDGMVTDFCFVSLGRMVCNRYRNDGSPSILYMERDGVQRVQEFHANGSVESSKYYSADGELARAHYDIKGTLRDTCFSLYHEKDRFDVCSYYETDGTPRTVQMVVGDTIFEKRFNRVLLMSECAIVWRGKEYESRRCRSYYKDGILRDSSIRIQKPDSIYYQTYGCDKEGKFDRYAENRYRRNGNVEQNDDKYCKIVNGKLVDCREEHRRREE